MFYNMCDFYGIVRQYGRGVPCKQEENGIFKDIIISRRQYIKFILLWMYYNTHYNKTSYKDHVKATDENNFNLPQNSTLPQELFTEFKKIKGLPDAIVNGERCRILNPYNSSDYKEIKSSDSDLKNVLEMIYALRCNLFHGGKVTNPDRADRKLISWAYTSLGKLMTASR